MHIQLVCDKLLTLSRYITKYQTKPEKSFNVAIFNDIENNPNLQSKLCNIGMCTLASRECGALEAADTLLWITLHNKDRSTVIKYVNVYRRRQGKVKNISEINKPKDDSTDIFRDSLIDDYYSVRPKELDNICFYHFASK